MAMLHHWIPEVTALIGSAMGLVALMVLLAVYDDKPIFAWHGVTLNTVVSVLSTASKAALFFALGESISQWKWTLFTNRTRPLMDFEQIDAASRGPLGSLRLMWECKKSSFVRIGALLVLLGIALDPFSQQLVQYRQVVVFFLDDKTTVSRAGRYAKGSEFVISLATVGYSPDISTNRTNVFVDTDFSMKSAILYGLDQPLQTVVQQSQFQCSTGNCTWPASESLAICSRCTDLGDKLQHIVSDGGLYVPLEKDNGAVAIKMNGGTAFRLPNGLYIDNLDTWTGSLGNADRGESMGAPGAVVMTTLGTGNASETVNMQNLDTLIWSQSMIRITPNLTNSSTTWPNLPHFATECALSYCVRSYKTSVINGTLQETSAQVAGTIRTPESWQYDVSYPSMDANMEASLLSSLEFDPYFSASRRSDLTLLSPKTDSRFNISQAAIDSISAYFQSTFATDLLQYNVSSGSDVQGRLNGWYMSSGQIQYEPSIMQVLLSSDNLTATFEAVAASMSNAIRVGADEVFEESGRSVVGEKGVLTTLYQVQWPWISLHCVILVVGTGFVFLTMLKNQNGGGSESAAPVWKSSCLAVLSRGDAVLDVFQGLQTVGEMERRARTEKVALVTKTVSKPRGQQQWEFDPLETDDV